MNNGENVLQEIQNDPTLMTKIFINRYGDIRAGWRMALNVGLYIVIIFTLLLFWKVFKPESSNTEVGSFYWNFENAINGVSLLAAAFISLRIIDKCPFGKLGLNFYKGWLKDMLRGAIVGFFMMMLVCIILLLVGTLIVKYIMINSITLFGFLYYITAFLTGAFWEELLTRGYLLQTLIEGTRPWVAIIILSGLFTAMHLGNENWSNYGTVSVFLAGILLSTAYLKTRSIWFPYGLHFSWNLTQSLWGVRVSGMNIDSYFINSELSGADIFSGGSVGIEGSIVTSIVVVLATIFILSSKWITASEYNRKLWDGKKSKI